MFQIILVTINKKAMVTHGSKNYRSYLFLSLLVLRSFLIYTPRFFANFKSASFSSLKCIDLYILYLSTCKRASIRSLITVLSSCVITPPLSIHPARLQTYPHSIYPCNRRALHNMLQTALFRSNSCR